MDREFTSFSDANPTATLCCRLQGEDAAIHGQKCLHISGLDKFWAADNGVRPGFSTLFFSETEIRPTELILDTDLESVTIDHIDPATIENRLTGDFEALIVRVETTGGAATTATEAELEQIFFGAPVSVSSQLDAISFGNFTLSRTTNTTYVDAGAGDGVYTVTIDFTIDANTEQDLLTSAIDTQLKADLAPNWEDFVDYYAYVLPGGTTHLESTSWTST